MTAVRSLLIALSLLVVSHAAAAPMASPRAGTFVLKGGTVHVGDGRVLQGATVVIDRGRVDVVEDGGALPAGAEVVDCAGQHVAPGFIAGDTTLGLVEIGAVRATRDDAEVGDLNPEVTAWAAYNPDSELLPVAMANGVLAAVVAPRGGLVPGQSGLMLLSGWTRDDLALKAPCALDVRWPSLALDRSAGATPSVEDQERSLKDRLETLDDLFARAAVDRGARTASPAEDRAENLKLRALEPALDGSIPVVVHADTVPQIRAALLWGRRHGVRLVLAGARDAWRVADEIAAAGVPVVVGDVRTMPAHDHDPYDAPFAQPGVLVKAGVKIAFTVGDPAHLRNLPDEAAMAIPYGLAPADAMRALTSWPAEIFGAGDVLGRLDGGRMANVVVWSGNPLEITSRAERLFVRGEELAIEDRQTKLYRKYRARPR